jgi:EAL domain-containing protein (putative c-di-GMP-specific phosphodiesterase class I)
MLEITESACAQDLDQIIQTADQLRNLGFLVEMDDFGSGYSSLNMISSLPIDALKLDMQFIRSAFRNGKDTRLIEVMIDIAEYLSVPVIAEGVETKEQMEALKALGCDYVQGYYFSKPVDPGEFGRFIEERKAADLQSVR